MDLLSPFWEFPSRAFLFLLPSSFSETLLTGRGIRWIHDFSTKIIQRVPDEPVYNLSQRFFFFFALSSGHGHAVTQAVVANQKILTENTGKRETGNGQMLWS